LRSQFGISNRSGFLILSLFLSAVACVSCVRAETSCAKVKEVWKNVDSYRCTYRALTLYEGKVKESLMTYSYQKPGKIRMDIQKPRKGVVLIYNPEVSGKVRVRPFPSFKSLVMNYDLTDKKVSSGSGGTLDRSDLGHRMESVCANPDSRRISFDKSGLLNKVEELDSDGKILESFEWINLEINPPMDPAVFKDF